MEALLANPKVKIRDVDAVKEKLQKIVADGSESLVVISDFDYTMSMYTKPSGELYSNGHMLFDNYVEKIDKEEHAKLKAFNEKHFAIEHSATLSHEEKFPIMVDWFKRVHQNVIDRKYTREQVEDIVRDSDFVLRHNVDVFIKNLEDGNIPLVIFSAGNATVIEILFEQHKMGLDNIHIVSNRLNFNDDGICDSFADPFIHCYSKSGAFLPPEDRYFHDYDLDMHKGVDRSGVTLKIGFYNHSENGTLLEKYLDGFDIILMGDDTFDVLNEVVKKVLSA
ncbi:hypothetical protein QR680_014253 [Steinernema hermaphroditum]|uniref:5'-nucleotidase n=1 Tax=Steinernema hermaphroditum TaxID=289476 RepID=A0AA39IAJ4_9BILA|nr:hypothetical protein QR680_014253 [Steinernema hermaphroditum]